jgi:hypothetical protein
MTEGTWQQHLVDLHPELFIRMVGAVPFSPGYPATSGDGWRDLVATLLVRVSAAATGYPIQFTQIREMHGRLAIHWRAEAAIPEHVERAIEEAIALAEARATCSCATCGAKARLFSSGGGQLILACPDHARGVPVPVRTGLEGVHIFRRRACDSSTLACVRYDWDNDQFVDVDPNLVGTDD